MTENVDDNKSAISLRREDDRRQREKERIEDRDLPREDMKMLMQNNAEVIAGLLAAFKNTNNGSPVSKRVSPCVPLCITAHPP
jgi:hypothetical protein